MSGIRQHHGIAWRGRDSFAFALLSSWNFFLWRFELSLFFGTQVTQALEALISTAWEQVFIV
jgi:hypothetical protein